MQRFLILTAALAAATGGLNAGTIQTEIGGPNGLTGTYINTGGSTGGFTEKNYDFYLFNGVMTAGPGTNYTQQSTGAAIPTNSLTDPNNPVSFALVDDGCGGTPAVTCSSNSFRTNNVWTAAQSANSTPLPSTIVVPIGIYDVTDVWTMLNNEYGLANAMNTTVEFDFGSTATSADGAVLVLNLTNSANNQGGTGQIRTGTVSSDNTCASCSVFANSSLNLNSTVNGIQVLTSRVFFQTYNSVLSNARTPFVGSDAGTVFLNDQGFIFGSYMGAQNSYLVDIRITDNNGVSGVSQTVLSAITVDSSTPEPASIFLGMTGLIGLGIVVARRRKVTE